MQKPNLVVLSPRFPYPLEKGDKLRMYYQLQGLSRYFRLHLIALSEHEIVAKDLEKVQPILESCRIIPQGSLRYLRGGIRSVTRGEPFQISYYYEQRIQKKIDSYISEIQPDYIFVQLVRMAAYVEHLSYPKVIDFMDAMSLNMLRAAEQSSVLKSLFYRRESRLLQQFERQYAQLADLGVIISEADQAYLYTLGIDQLHVQPNGVDTAYFSRAAYDTAVEYDIAFVGNMGYQPNIVAAEYLINRIVKPYFPELKILIAGARPSKRVEELTSEHVTVSGWVEDIRSAYCSARMLVAPIFSGAGQQNKILEAMSLEIPCVTTPQVNAAILAKDGHAIEIANDEAAFKQKILKLINNPTNCREIGKNARIFVASKYNWDSQIDQLSRAITTLK